jgi:hypothetical protein
MASRIGDEDRNLIEGGFLCGRIRFEIDAFVGPFELCHCSRCRKASGSAFVSGVGVKIADFRWISGRDEIRRFEAPVVERPPGYQTAFYNRCGPPAPDFEEGGDWFELAAGLLDGDPEVPPDRHIFVECGSRWYTIAGDLPRPTKEDVIRMRLAGGR